MKFLTSVLLFLFAIGSLPAIQAQPETKVQHDTRMEWWRDARFGMFIHWGLYAIPAGQWDGKTDYGEWIRHSAQIPLETYDQFQLQFNPVKFDADEWVKTARDAGMKYIVITSKHHDGFCMFNTTQTGFNITQTPFGRDVMKELADACRKYDLKFCFYYSIMDWHHPDYLPRRTWETERNTDSADFDRYVSYMKEELKELLTQYGEIGVLWFDGEWETTWNDNYGKEIYAFVRSIQPDIIINNRVGAGRMDMEGMTEAGAFGGDFGTPEQQIPPTGLPGTDWETCMTMNDHWGYNKANTEYKSAQEIIRMLADIASKGGNYLINVGPTDKGTFPKQALYLLPEIALTTQIISRLKRYFGDRAGVYHSRFNEQEKAEIWNRTIDHQYDVILGARSAIFAPFTNLGLIIVDEEHDSSFKQYDPAPRYNGRDAAIILGKLHDAKVLLGSATPSIESYFNARQGKYGLVELMTRYREMELPQIEVVDIKQEHREGKMKSHFSSALLAKMEMAVKNREQVILFQNRRGFSLRLECETCHWMPSCKNCDVTLVYHKKINQLRCHYCGYVARIPERCPECNGLKIRMKGFGTERVEEDLEILMPDARVARMDLDTTRSKHGLQKILGDFEARKTDILIGTQMVTKGLDFDHVSTVCILNADNMLSYPDFRSGERSYQLMAQVGGRSGRKKKRGEVIIQTWQPSNPIIQYVVNNDYQGMYLAQLNDRKQFNYPPFYRLIVIRLKHRKPDVLNQAAASLASDLKARFGKRILGPEYPMVARVMNLYIKQIMIKLERGGETTAMKEKIKEILDGFYQKKEFSGVRLIIDVDSA